MDKKVAKKTPSKKRKLITILVIIVIVIAVVIVCVRAFKNREAVAFSEHLDDVAATINGESLLYRDLSFYVLYEEMQGEKEARVYNPESSKDWWNSYVNGKFVSVTARETAMDMAVHDRIMYDLAKKDNITLTSEEENQVAMTQSDFWEDLFDEQKKNLPVSKEEINEQIKRIAIGEKYQNKLAEEKGVNSFEYNYDGYLYKQMLDSDYKVKIDDNYDKLVFGEITIHHDKVNFINGLTDEKKEEMENRKK